MTHVEIDDYECEHCGQKGTADLNIDSGDYKSDFCNCEEVTK